MFFAKNLIISNEKRSKRYIIDIIKAENTSKCSPQIRFVIR